MKKILIFIIMMLLSIYMVSAVTVTLDSQGILTNQSFQSSSSVTPNIKAVGNSSTFNCVLYTDENISNGQGNWRAVQTDSGVTNNTNVSFSIRQSVADVSGITYNWDVFCNSSNDPNGAWGGGSNTSHAIGAFQYAVDTVNPSITVNSPSDLSWDTDGNVFWNFTVIDDNVDSCILSTNLNASTNTTGNFIAKETIGYVNNTLFNFSFGQTTNIWDDNGDGDYIWHIICNDSAGRITTEGNNTILVDTVAPSAFVFNVTLWRTNNRNLLNDTTATDYTPRTGWDITTESNFSRYEIIYFKDAYGAFDADTDLRVNVSSRTQTIVNISTLAADSSYQVLITAYDQAGNSRNMTKINYKYSTDSTNRALDAGWNLIGNVGNSFNLSEILDWTGATTVAIWNGTHEFTTHVSGGTNGQTQVGAGEVAFVFLSEAITFSDSIQNITAVDETAHVITNQSASDWNLVMMRDDDDDKLFGEIDRYLNCNSVPNASTCNAQANDATFVDYLDLFNNTGTANAKYITLVANWSIANSTIVTFGDPIWMFLDGTEKNNITINWTAIV